MKRTVSALLLLTLWLGACASNPTPAPAQTESAPLDNNEQAPAQREAVLSEFENEVVARALSDGEFIAAQSGFVIQQGGALQTGETGRARLDLTPEGTIIRVSPNSAFSLPEITETGGEPQTSVELFFGKIFVLLNGGSLDVQTPSGVASVRGSLLSISYNPATGRIQTACLEGRCSLENESGEEIELVEGESGYVDENGEIYELDGIDRDEVQEWLDEAPELGAFLGELPDPDDFSEYDEFESYEFDPSTYYEEGSADDGFYDFEEDTSDDEFDSTEEPQDDLEDDSPSDDEGSDEGSDDGGDDGSDDGGDDDSGG